MTPSVSCLNEDKSVHIFIICINALTIYVVSMLLICLFTVNSPIPSNLKSEAKKAAKILREFTEISNRQGPDKLIPGKRYLSITFLFFQVSFFIIK